METLERKKAFVLALHDESVMFQCSSRAEMDDWHSDLRYYSGGSSKRPEDRGGRTPSAHAPAATGEIYESASEGWSLGFEFVSEEME